MKVINNSLDLTENQQSSRQIPRQHNYIITNVINITKSTIKSSSPKGRSEEP